MFSIAIKSKATNVFKVKESTVGLYIKSVNTISMTVILLSSSTHSKVTSYTEEKQITIY